MEPNQKRRILVIDDNPAIHDDFKKILGAPAANQDLAALESALFDEAPKAPTQQHFELHSAFQGQEGLACVTQALADQNPFALAFIDVRMPPGWDGIETTLQIWKIDPHIQVVICTAYSDYSWSEMIGKLGESDRLVILKKPFDNIEVTQLAHALTHKWQLQQAARQKMLNLEDMVQVRTAELTTSNLALTREIAERKNLELERQTMEVQLRQSQKLEAIGQLAAGVAHEINTPIQYVGDNTRFIQESFVNIVQLLQDYSNLLSAVKSQAPANDLVVDIEKNLAEIDLPYLFVQVPAAIRESLEGINRVAKIVRTMKEFSHPGSKNQVLADINKAIESTAEVARNEWRRVADLKLDLDPELPTVPCFLNEFNQCILNLIINAAHAIGDVVREKPGTKGLITIQTRHLSDQVEITVSDTGSGIPEIHRPHIFEPFFTTKEVGKGTGQGLTIVYASIVKKHQGTVHFETECGRGTSFILRLPLAPAIPPVTSTTETSFLRAAGFTP